MRRSDAGRTPACQPPRSAYVIGIVAIVFSTQVNSKLNQGDLEGAQRASANAKTWCWVATAFAIIGLLINIAMFATGGMEQYMMMMEQIQQSQ